LPLTRLLILVLTVQMAVFGHVERVVDGDTIRVRVGTALETVRYIGVDTPETVHPTRGVEPYGKAASRFNASLVEGKQVRLEFDVERRDRYGRLLAYVYVDTLFVNAELVRRGYAQLMTIPPNVRHVDHFVRSQRDAREAGAGLWGPVSAPIDPLGPPYGENKSRTEPDVLVYVTKSGKKHHRAGCRYLRSSCIAIPLSIAREAYEPCSVCNPLPGVNDPVHH
jgi:micrococcal nuclease